MSDLRERVAREFAGIHWHVFLAEADAAIALVLEEAARVVDEMPLSHPGNAAETALECAAAIRALGGKDD